MKVLHVSHTGLVSGAEHSLLTLLAAMPAEIELGLACPAGELAAAARELGVRVHELPGTTGSLKLHPVHTPAALAEMLLAAASLARLTRRTGATVVHANSIRAGMIAGAARALGSPPVVTHVRDVLPAGRASQFAKATAARGSHSVVAISRYVARAFSAGLRAQPRIAVVDNPVDLQQFDPDTVVSARADLGIADRVPLLGIVGQITSWKGHDTAIRALAVLRATHPQARLLVVGDIAFAAPSTRLDNQAFLDGLRRLIAELRLQGAVTFLGTRHDVPRLLAALDVLLVPSVEEPFGRTVAEAMAMRTPVLATTVGGPAELIDSGSTGVLVPPGQPDAWAAAARHALDAPDETAQMAVRAQELAHERFEPQRHAAVMRSLLDAASEPACLHVRSSTYPRDG